LDASGDCVLLMFSVCSLVDYRRAAASTQPLDYFAGIMRTVSLNSVRKVRRSSL
jgi:hypothetical protein